MAGAGGSKGEQRNGRRKCLSSSQTQRWTGNQPQPSTFTGNWLTTHNTREKDVELGAATRDRAAPVCWYGKTSKTGFSKQIADGMLFHDGICVHVLRTHTYGPTRVHESLPERFMHTQQKEGSPSRPLCLWLAPFRASFQFFSQSPSQ